MIDLLLQHIGTIIGAGSGGFFGWFFTRKQSAANTKTTEAGALIQMDEAYTKLSASMNDRFDRMQLEIDGVNKENAELKVRMKKIDTENRSLKKLVEKLQG
jgi:archaellum component FlaC